MFEAFILNSYLSNEDYNLTIEIKSCYAKKKERISIDLRLY